MTPHADAAKFISALIRLGFVEAETPGESQRYDLKTAEGHANLRLHLEYFEGQIQGVSAVKLCGSAARLIVWECSLSAYMPIAAIAAMLQAA